MKLRKYAKIEEKEEEKKQRNVQRTARFNVCENAFRNVDTVQMTINRQFGSFTFLADDDRLNQSMISLTLTLKNAVFTRQLYN